jgi:glycosidase
MGDLPGILSRIDYLEWLGIGALNDGNTSRLPLDGFGLPRDHQF